METVKAICNGEEYSFNVDDTNKVSDGYHTFEELYDHRITLFIALCRLIELGEMSSHEWTRVWRSRKHHESDTEMYDGWFVLGLTAVDGKQISYHLPLSRWEETNFTSTLPHAPKWDGHTPQDVLERLKNL